MTLFIDGPRVRLRRFTSADLPDLLRLAANPGFRAEVEELGSDESGARAYLAKKDGYADFEPEKVFDLAVEIRRGSRIAGLVSLFRRPDDQGEVGYALHAADHGLGYATEAAGILIDHAFDVLGMHRLYIRTRCSNQRAAAVAHRLGFRLEGTSVEATDMADPRADLLLFGLLRREWEQDGPKGQRLKVEGAEDG